MIVQRVGCCLAHSWHKFDTQHPFSPQSLPGVILSIELGLSPYHSLMRPKWNKTKLQIGWFGAKETIQGVKVLALHKTNSFSIPRTAMTSWTLPGVISEQRDRNKPWVQLSVAQIFLKRICQSAEIVLYAVDSDSVPSAPYSPPAHQKWTLNTEPGVNPE